MTRLVSCIYIVFCIVLLLDDCLNVKCSFEEVDGTEDRSVPYGGSLETFALRMLA